MSAFDETLNSIESRLSAVEQYVSVSTSSTSEEIAFSDTDSPVVQDTLDWYGYNWVPYSKLTGVITDESNPSYPGGSLSNAYHPFQVSRVGNIGFLSGMVRRKTGTPTLTADVEHREPIVGLPYGWRPVARIPFAALAGSDTASQVPNQNVAVLAWLEIRPDNDESPSERGGRVHFVTAKAAIAPGTGWVSINVAFPLAQIGDDLDEDAPAGAQMLMAAAPEPKTWEDVILATGQPLGWYRLGEK
jgi:hypothetical protein